MLHKYIISALLMASLTGCFVNIDETERQSGWYGLDNKRGDCSSINYGPTLGDKITNPSLGECAFDALAKSIELDDRKLSNISKPRLSESRGYYDNYEIVKYDFDYALAKPDYYGSTTEDVGDYLTSIQIWNPKLECKTLRDTQNLVYAVSCDAGRIKVTSYGPKVYQDAKGNEYWLLNIKQTLP